jgi:hypothetical protein
VPDDEPIAVALLRYVDDYVDESDVNEAVSGGDLDSDSNLIVFYRELFSQLFANVLAEPITSISLSSARRARRLQLTKGGEWSRPLKALVRSFQHLCKIYRDLLGEQYGEGGDAVSELHFDLLPTLLLELQAWAKDEGLEELEKATRASAAKYRSFIDAFDPVAA